MNFLKSKKTLKILKCIMKTDDENIQKFSI